MAKPNLFDYASSELSQDAMISWLLAWADPVTKLDNAEMHTLGTGLVAAFLSLHGQSMPAIGSLKIIRQHKGVDVLAVINDDLHLLIEDKTATREHSGQLTRYVESILAKAVDRKSVIPVYLQTGDQCDYDIVENSDYRVLGRRELIEILQAAPIGAKAHPLVSDFVEHLLRKEAAVNSFATATCKEWKGGDPWVGFFKQLREEKDDGAWGYVSNPRGGFMGFWWKWLPASDGIERYLQLEEESLCFKIGCPEGNAVHRRGVRERWLAALTRAAAECGVQIENRKGRVGRSMTVAALPGDYRQRDTNDLLDLEATLRMLAATETVMERAYEYHVVQGAP